MQENGAQDNQDLDGNKIADTETPGGRSDNLSVPNTSAERPGGPSANSPTPDTSDPNLRAPSGFDPSHPPQNLPQTPKRRKSIAKLLLVGNGLILGLAGLMIVSAPLLGPAAIVPALLLLAMLPFAGILCIIDFVALTVFLFRRIAHKDYSKPKIVLAACIAWIIVGILIVPLSGPIREQFAISKASKGLDQEATVQLIQSCKIASFYKAYQAGSDGNSPGDEIALAYKDPSLGGRRYPHSTAPKNFDAVLAAARASAGKCGKVVYYCSLGTYYIGGGSEGVADESDCNQPQASAADPGTCKAVWTTNNRQAPTDQLALGSVASDGVTAVKVLRTVLNPPTVGDAPDAGTQFLEIDLSIAGKVPQDAIFTYWPSLYPQCGIEAMGAVDSPTGFLQPLTNAAEPSKKVTIPNKTSVTTNSSTATEEYMLVEIQPDDKGYMTWTDSRGTDHHLALY